MKKIKKCKHEWFLAHKWLDSWDSKSNVFLVICKFCLEKKEI